MKVSTMTSSSLPGMATLSTVSCPLLKLINLGPCANAFLCCCCCCAFALIASSQLITSLDASPTFSLPVLLICVLLMLWLSYILQVLVAQSLVLSSQSRHTQSMLQLICASVAIETHCCHARSRA